MANYNVNIINGEGSQVMQKGTYNVTATAVGYDVSSLEPKTFNVTEEEGSLSFTLSAIGTLTIIVNETGADGGTPISSGSIRMVDSTGTIEYGEIVPINATGEAVFNNVPFDPTNSSITLYFKQISSDENHNLNEEILSVVMSQENQVAYIQNSPLATQTFSLKDTTYGLPINGNLEFSNTN